MPHRPIEPSSWVLKYIYPILAGCCIFLAFESYNIVWTLFLLPFFLNGMRGLQTRSKLIAYWIMAIVTNLGGFHWITIVATDFGGVPKFASWGILLLFSVLNNLNFVLWAYLERLWGEPDHPFVTAAFFVVAEQLNPQLFPWYFGTALDSVLPFYQTADIWGVPGLSFVLTSIIFLPYWIWKKRHNLLSDCKIQLMLQIAFVACVCGYGLWRMNQFDNAPGPGKKSVAVSIVQPNTRMEKFYGQRQTREERYNEFLGLIELSAKAIEAHPDRVLLVVWPEGGIHFQIMRSRDVLQQIKMLARNYGVFVSAGSVEFVGKKPNGRWEYYNSQFVFNPDGELAGKYRKIILLAFGEYTPFLDRLPFLEDMLPETISNFSRGQEKPVFELGADIVWLPLICYEDIILGFVEGFEHHRADFFVNTTNDGWFGRSDASHLHKQMARVRTVEYRKPMVRALNTGTSQVIDAAGRTISEETPLYEQAFINTTLHLPETPPVSIFSIVGRWPVFLLMGAVGVLSLRRWLQSRINKKAEV